MACFHSRPVWQNNPGDPLQFQWRNDRPPEYFIDCGKCEGCRARQAQDWGIRIVHEAQSYDRNCFVTLTYDDEHLPESIMKSDIQHFIKRLQRREKNVRYFVTGEYGDRTRRPHYHAILFGIDFLGGSYPINERMYGNKILDSIWQQGQCAVENLTTGSAMYTAGYTAKKIGSKDTFSLQSRQPPIGQRWLRAHHDNIRRNCQVVIEGKTLPVPRVYLNWLKGAETFAHIKEVLAEKVKPLNDKKLAAKKANYKAKRNLKSETI